MLKAFLSYKPKFTTFAIRLGKLSLLGGSGVK